MFVTTASLARFWESVVQIQISQQCLTDDGQAGHFKKGH